MSRRAEESTIFLIKKFKIHNIVRYYELKYYRYRTKNRLMALSFGIAFAVEEQLNNKLFMPNKKDLKRQKTFVPDSINVASAVLIASVVSSLHCHRLSPKPLAANYAAYAVYSTMDSLLHSTMDYQFEDTKRHELCFAMVVFCDWNLYGKGRPHWKWKFWSKAEFSGKLLLTEYD